MWNSRNDVGLVLASCEVSQPVGGASQSMRGLPGIGRMCTVRVHCAFVSLDLRTLQLVASCEGQDGAVVKAQTKLESAADYLCDLK